MIINTIKQINNDLLSKKFANKYLSDARTLRIGNIVSCLCPVDINLDDNKIISDESINFLVEIPEISNYAGVCFQQLFLTNIANILSNKIMNNVQIEIINNDIIIKKEHDNAGIHQLDGIASGSLIKNINGAILIYVGLYNKTGKLSIPRAFSLQLSTELCYKYMDMINESFYHLVNNIFLKTSKM
jgi:hypothetical protein